MRARIAGVMIVAVVSWWSVEAAGSWRPQAAAAPAAAADQQFTPTASPCGIVMRAAARRWC